MALTRPKIWDLDTNIQYFMDPLTVLHQSSTAANVDVGFIFNRANGIVSNVALYWSESTGSFVTAFTSSDGTTNSNVSVSSYANLTIGSLITVNGAGLVLGSSTGINLNGSYGSSGQVLSSTGTGVQWAASGGFSGGPVPNQTTFASDLVAASGTASTNTTTGALVVVGGAGITGNVYVSGNIVQTSTGYHQIPAGTSAQRPGAPSLGMIRYNSTISSYEGYGAGSAWSSLGGVKSVDGYAYITAEASAGAADDVLRFYSGSTGSSVQVMWASGSNISILPTTVSTSTTTGALQVAGGLGVAGAAYHGSVYDNSLRVVSTVNTTAGTGISLSGQTTTGPTTAVTITNSGVTGLSSSGTGNVTVSALTGSVTVSLSATGPGAATVGSSTAIPIITTDPYGRVSATSTAAVVAPAGTLSGSVLATGITTIGTSGSNLTASGSLVVSGNLYVQGTTTTVNTSLQTSNVVATTGLLVSGAYLGSYSDGVLVDYVTGIGRFSVGTLDAISFYNNADSSRQLLGNLTYNGLFNLPISGAAYQISGTSVLNATTLGSGVTASSLTSVGTISSGTWSGSFGAVSGANLTNLTAGNLSGTIPSAVLGNSTLYVGTTAIALNRTSASQTLTGVSVDGSAASATTATTASYVSSPDGDRNASTKLPTTSGNKVRFDFSSASSAGTSGNYAGVMTYAPWDGTTASTGDASYQLAFGSTATNGSGYPKLNIRKGIDSTWNSWYNIFHSGQTNTPSADNTWDLGASGTRYATVYGVTFSGVSTTAKYADLAERYTSDANYPAGTVVVFGGNKEITISTQNHDTTVAGVISTDPAYLMNSELDGVSVALTGRVPCQVQGPVRKGQVLVTSDTPGVAQAIDNSKFLPGCIVGKALEAINTNTIETIEVVVGRF